MEDFNPLWPSDDRLMGVYLHIPFCMGRCAYCAFVTNPHDPAGEELYVRSLLREMDLWAAAPADGDSIRHVAVDSIYLGGGTPSIVRTDLLVELIDACMAHFRIADEPEITVEVNPATAALDEIRELRIAGVNRVSLGVQSLDDEELRRMGRGHTAREAIRTFNDLRRAGFNNISVDLIAGFPQQSLSGFLNSLRGVIELRPEHLSVYLLELKDASELQRQIVSGEVPLPDDDLTATMYEELCSGADAAGYEQYEISNFALEGRRCRHNLKYWSDEIFLGLGAGAHGMTGRTRYANLESLAQYAAALESGELPFHSVTRMTPETRFKDALIMGLRLVEGLDMGLMGGRYGVDVRSFVMETAGDLCSAGLFVMEGDNLALTPKGRLLSNTLFSRWV